MYETKRITDNSYKDIHRLYGLSFPSNHSLDDVIRKYDTQMFGLKNIGVIAESNELAAYYGVFPIVLNYKDKDYLIAQSGDTMTARGHRHKGLFIRLAKETYSLAKAKGIRMIYGFPNKNSYPGFKNKLSWEFHGFMWRFTFKVCTIPFCELAAKFNIFQALYNRFVRIRIAKYQIEINQINFNLFNFSKVKGHIKKDRNFFEYKLKKDTYIVLINGFQMLIKAKTHLYIGEVGRINPDQSDMLIRCVKKLARMLGCKKVIFTLSRNHWLFDILSKDYTPANSLPIGFYLIDKSINPTEIQFSNADYDTF